MLCSLPKLVGIYCKKAEPWSNRLVFISFCFGRPHQTHLPSDQDADGQRGGLKTQRIEQVALTWHLPVAVVKKLLKT